MAQALAVLGASLVITAAVAYAWLRHLPNSGRFAGLFLRQRRHQADGYISALPRADLVGQDGVAVTDLRPAGTAQIGAERVDVVTEGEYVAAGRARSGWCAAKDTGTCVRGARDEPRSPFTTRTSPWMNRC